MRLRNVLNTSRRHLEDLLTRTVELNGKSGKRLEDIFKMSWEPLEDMSWRHFCKIYWRRLEDEDDSKTSWRRLEDVLKTFLQGVLETSLRHFENVLKVYYQDKYIGLDQDVEKTLKESSEYIWVSRIYSSW